MILVTGGAGYIGSHYVLHELARGSDVLVVDNLVDGHSEAALYAPFVMGDTGDRALFDRLLSEHPIDAVVHFAAYAHVGESVERPGKYYNNNLVSTLHLLDAMRDHGVSRFVFSSSCATYGNPRYVPMDEQHPQEPINPYGDSKLMCEHIMAAYDHAHGLRYTSLRYFNAAGADPEGRVGESHDPETHIIPLVLGVAAGRSDHVQVFGTDYDTPDGTCIRDYVHVLDLAAAHALALDRLRDGAPSTAYNLGTETGHSVREVLDVCSSVTGRPIKAVDAERRPGDPPRLVASSGKARAELGWRPTHGDLKTIVETAWHWEQNRRY
ncbi:MAG TPA: UDP-glucose 4-epimerase GalE [Chthonomonadales bacterium]|nr:UDP-glucose 4-epimerase GalE [Chthonomonadales bacterium]